MTKNTIYSLAVFYQTSIGNRELALSDTRYFRDAFREYVEKAMVIEEDRKAINEKYGRKSPKKEAEELDKLFSETVEGLPSLPEDLDDRIEAADIRVRSAHLELLDLAR